MPDLVDGELLRFQEERAWRRRRRRRRSRRGRDRIWLEEEMDFIPRLEKVIIPHVLDVVVARGEPGKRMVLEREVLEELVRRPQKGLDFRLG
jgi:hypothetical protein